jgi:HAMP domain-containing protein
MKLAVKFNLVFLGVFAVGLAAAAYVSSDLLERSAREEILQNARLIMEEASAARTYTSSQIAPLLNGSDNGSSAATFLPQSVPAYGATEELNLVREKFPDYAYKEASLNPTNPRDHAVEWETDVINRFRQYPEQTEIIGDRDTPSGRSLFLARQMRVGDAQCLGCHSTVEAAPKAMIARYGPANGFGWKVHEIIGAQIVSVPQTIPLGRAHRALYTFMAFLGTLLLALLVALNLMLRAIVIRPVTLLAKAADNLSLGKLDGADFPAGRGDELSLLAESFNRMKKSLAHALKLLDE